MEHAHQEEGGSYSLVPVQNWNDQHWGGGGEDGEKIIENERVERRDVLTWRRTVHSFELSLNSLKSFRVELLLFTLQPTQILILGGRQPRV